ncbi:kinase-like domain-containing protein [Mycena filopes]|nr:kinase-like domain-containing protein [Mycena filopes]
MFNWPFVVDPEPLPLPIYYGTPPTSRPLTASDANDSDREYIWQLPDRKVENVARYHPGGLHPVHLSDMHSGSDGTSYRIIHKLGFGSFSTVWLAQDTELSKNRAVALKFITSASMGSTNEVAIHQYLVSRPHTAGYDNILMAVDTFQVDGPNGLHNVLVTDVVSSVYELCKFRLIDHLNELDIIRQIFQGVAFLHDNGIVHGDLHCGNIAVEFPVFRAGGMKKIFRSEVPVLFPCVACDPTLTTPSVPKYVVANTPVSLRGMRKDASELVVKLVDFGCAFRPGTDDLLIRRGGPPRALTAPECLSADSELSSPLHSPVPWSYHSDIWTLACSLFELYSRQPGQNPLFAEDSIGLEMARLLGPIPARHRRLLALDTDPPSPEMSFQSQEDFGESSVAANWLVVETSLRTARTSKDVDQNGNDEQNDVATHHFRLLIQQMLRWEPKDRISANEAVRSRLFSSA